MPIASVSDEGDGAAGEGDTQRALAIARADIGADQRHQRRAEAEDQRHQQIFEPRAGAVAGDRDGAGCARHQRGGERDDHVGLHRGDRGDGADIEDVAEQRPAQTAQAQRARLRPERMYQPSTAAPAALNRTTATPPPAMPSAGKRADAEDEARRQRDEQDNADSRSPRPAPACCRCRGSRWPGHSSATPARCRRTPRWNRSARP